MPYVHLSTNVSLSKEMKADLLEEIAVLLPILPGKNRDNAMVELDGDKFIAMGEVSLPCVFCEIRLYRQSPDAAKEEFAAKFTALLGDKLGVEPGRVYLNFMEMEHWGLGGGII